MFRHMNLRLALLLPVLLLPACASAEGASEAEPRADRGASLKGPQSDASSTLACRHFRNVMGDIDVLTIPELREKVAEFEQTASVTDVQPVKSSSRAMLVAATADDGEGFLQSAGEMSQACSDVGQ